MDKRGARANAVSGQMRLPEDSTKPEEMTDEQLRLAIAELAGWKREELLVFRAEWEAKDRVSGGAMDEAGVPDYLDDLNAVHEVEKRLNNTLYKFDYAQALEEALDLIPEEESFGLREHRNFAYATATARQRCIALVRVLGKRHRSENGSKSNNAMGASNPN